MARRRSYRLVTFCCFMILIGAFSFGYYMNSGNNQQGNDPGISTQPLTIDQNNIDQKIETRKENIDNPDHEGGEGLADQSNDMAKPVNTDSAELKTSADTKLLFRVHYEGCGHDILTENTVTEDEVGITEADLKIKYSDWSMENFSAQQVIFTKSNDGKCPNHYIVKEYQGEVGLFYQNAPEGKESFVRLIDNINLKQLRQDDREKIQNGIFIDSDEELAQLIEDFNS
ncbi:BofC C-terminal domain-containing protein [Petroclostridium sp. X23]|uniref:BofC C-terminal domain-containing protein n=1 Tax=Petroclostridium sp. X23 TaxID=3045146 RepID=UPI0024AE37C8|nr:BofC C-terminal domain-containing protein [Petroclostridium sp. X23]WHH59302.1 BofC C-terminal domain-containing protein [Petroclostridium sp. X23]